MPQMLAKEDTGEEISETASHGRTRGRRRRRDWYGDNQRGDWHGEED